MQIKVSEIVFREDLYPRIAHNPQKIQEYAGNIDVLPPIEINQHNILIDGFHRWTAHKKLGLEFIEAMVIETESDKHLKKLAIQKNAAHGLQLSMDDKRKLAMEFYDANSKADSKREISSLLSVSYSVVQKWVKNLDEQYDADRNRQIFDLHLACYTQQEIADAVGMAIGQVNDKIKVCSELVNLPKPNKLAATFEEESWQPPLYNVWTFAKKSNEVSHFGNSEARILENLIYLYTEPFDIVVDPFAGGGSTIDVCKKRSRRYWVSDRKPIVERENEIRLHDIADGTPPLNKRWSDVSLTYLDPPYWKQAEGKYSSDSQDLANMSLDDFTRAMASLISDIGSKQSKGVICLLIQPTQWNAPNRKIADHVADIIKAVNGKKMTVCHRISCPYSTEQYNAQQVEWAKHSKELLVLTRELIVWKHV